MLHHEAMLDDLTLDDLAFLDAATIYWRTITRSDEERRVRALAAKGWLQVRRQARRGFADLYRLPHSEVPENHPARRGL